MLKEQEVSTLDRIHMAATEEFLNRGYRAASLRNIVKHAGVTTGAFYGYYESKEQLFNALVGEQADYVIGLCDRTLRNFGKLPGEEQTRRMTEISQDTMLGILDYIYRYPDIFKMLLLCAEGTEYADFVEQLVERETKSTFDYIETLGRMGRGVENISEKLVHMVASGLFSGMFETVIHDMPYEEAKTYLLQLKQFHTAGWEALLHIRFD